MVYMTQNELRFRYNQMDKSYDRMLILAELNGCNTREIENALNERPEYKHQRPPKPKRTPKQLVEDRMWQMYQYRCADTYIAAKLGVTAISVHRWRKKNDLPTLHHSKVYESERQAWDALFA